MDELKKAASLSDAPEFEEIKKENNEMNLVDPENFEGKISEEVKESDLEEIYVLAQEMIKFAHARGGIGLAFSQVGINKKGFVYLNNSGAWEVVLNPSYFGDGKKIWVYERSLSYEDVYAVQRYKRIRAVFYSIEVGKDDRLYMKKRYMMMSGLKAFAFENLTDFTVGKTQRTLGVRLREENEQQK